MNYSPFTCLDPQLVRNKYNKEWITVPCGKCEACLSLKSQRLMSKIDDEAQQHSDVFFVTLTFDDSHIPSIDVSSLELELQPWYENYLASDTYRSVYGDKIYHLSVSDLQLFFKRLRKKIYDYFTANDLEVPRIRYYACGEYGCTSFRPHNHLLLFFDCPELALVLERFIREAWSINVGSTFTPIYESIGNIRCERVANSCSSYVSSYCTSLSQLPSILQHSDFAPFHLQSSRPALGLYRPKYNYKQIAFDDKKIYYLKTNKQFKTFISEFPCSFVSRYFPRCTKFHYLSVSQLVKLYSFTYYFCYFPDEKTSDFVNRILSYIIGDRPCYLGSYESILNSLEYYLSLCTADAFDSLLKLTYLSRRFIQNYYELKKFNSFRAYVQFIVNFWQKRDYAKLCSQLRFEEEYCNRPFVSSKHKGFVLMIDSNFFRRNLDDVAIHFYSEQFDLSMRDFRDVSDYKKFADKSIERYFSHIKAKLDREYLITHPEFSAFHPVDLY